MPSMLLIFAICVGVFVASFFVHAEFAGRGTYSDSVQEWASWLIYLSIAGAVFSIIMGIGGELKDGPESENADPQVTEAIVTTQEEE